MEDVRGRYTELVYDVDDDFFMRKINQTTSDGKPRLRTRARKQLREEALLPHQNHAQNRTAVLDDLGREIVRRPARGIRPADDEPTDNPMTNGASTR